MSFLSFPNLTKVGVCNIALLTLMTCSQSGWAQSTSSTSSSPSSTRLMTPHDIWAIKRVDNPVVSPDQKWIAFTLQTWSIEKNRPQTNIWLMDAQGKQQRRLTTADANDSAPVWSPDGSRIAYTSKRLDDEAPALYVLRMDGGEAEKVLELPFGVSSPRWLPDGRSLIVGTNAIPALKGNWSAEHQAALKKEIKRRRDSKMTAKVTEDRTYRYFDRWLTDKLSSHLLQLDLDSKKLSDLTPDSKDLFSATGGFDFEIAPDGSSVALTMNTTPAPYAESENNDVILIALNSRDKNKSKNLTLDNRGNDSSAQFSSDGKFIFYIKNASTFYDGSSSKLWRHDVRAGKNEAVLQTHDYAFSDFSLSKDGKKIWTAVEDQGEVSIFTSHEDGKQFERIVRDGAMSKVKQVGHQLIFLQSRFDRPNEIMAFDLTTKKYTQLTHFNDELMAQFKFGKVESYNFKGANDETVQGWLILPPDYDKTKSYPLLQLMHGGPHTMVGNSFNFRWNAHLMAAPGYIVSWVNRHGSTGFGESFARSINGQWGQMPTQDILRSNDYLIQKLGNIDRKRIAAAGASYGGFLAAWLAGHTDQFATIIDHAGVNDFIAQYGSDSTNYSFEKTLGGSPWKNQTEMLKNNPMTYAENFKTPMLLTHGEMDYRVPYVNSTALYGVLQSMKVPSRLVIFPNENHWILSPQNSIYWNWEVQNWLQRYIGGTPTLSQPQF